LLVGQGAEDFALEQGVVLVPNSYFRTEARVKALEQALKEEKEQAGHKTGARFEATWPIGSTGTVGAVALDREGNLAAATSTGGLTNKRPGRVGDSPLIGAGTYADNATCAVSGTGQGEYFIRLVAAYDIAALMAYKQASLKDAAEAVVMKKLAAIKAEAGVIAVDRQGNIAMPFNTEGMYRGSIRQDGQPDIAIY
jgi:beta-aspartyl-peptidase (threonine type)